jgi:ribonuclease P protein component
MRWYEALRRSSEIAHVRRRPKAASLTTLDVYAVPARQGGSSVAVTVSKAVGKAVVRNLVRRRIRGALDAVAPLGSATRLVFVAKPAAATASYAGLAADVAVALGRLSAASGRSPERR